MVSRAFDIWRKVEIVTPASEAESDFAIYVNDLATALSLVFDVHSPLADTNCVFADLLACALHRVDWHELAAKLLSAQKESVMLPDEG